MIKVYPKGRKLRAGEYFDSYEFDCPCDYPSCRFTYIDPDLVKRLDAIRTSNGPIIINSGFRCWKHQQDLRSKMQNDPKSDIQTVMGISTHEQGMAADWLIHGKTGGELEVLAKNAGFRAIGTAGGWVHTDTRADKIRRWRYPT